MFTFSRTILFSIVIFLAMFSSGLGQYPKCPPTWVPFFDGKCYKLNAINMPFDVAVAACGVGATLAAFHDYWQLLKFVALLVPPINQNPQPFNCVAIWTGLNDIRSEAGGDKDGPWEFRDGSPYDDRERWAAGFPQPDTLYQGNVAIENDCVFVVPGVAVMNGACWMPLCSICQRNESWDTTQGQLFPSLTSLDPSPSLLQTSKDQSANTPSVQQTSSTTSL